MIWNMQQVRQARSIYMDMDIYDEYLNEIGPDAISSELGKGVAEIGSTYGLILDSRDMQVVRVVNYESPFTVRFRCVWSPITKNCPVQLYGKRMHGKKFIVKDIHEPLVIPYFDQETLYREDYNMRTVVVQRNVTYNLDGWNEHGRCWVMRG